MERLITRRAALGSIMGCACCVSGLAGAHAAEKAHAPHWGYKGKEAPEHWAELSADFKTCKIGMEQTPIDLNSGVKAQFDRPFSPSYRAVGGTVVNNGHTIQVNLEKGCSCMIEGTSYDLAQFHFHHPSEHLLAGKAFDMEVHLVHKAASGDLAVIGMFLKEGASNAALTPVFDGMPAKAGGEKPLGATFDPSALFPVDHAYFRYMGSLTTPPCSEGLTWTVFKQPIEASAEQIRKFAALFPHNARPVQSRNRRFILETSY